MCQELIAQTRGTVLIESTDAWRISGSRNPERRSGLLHGELQSAAFMAFFGFDPLGALYEINYGIIGGAADLCKVQDTYYLYNVHPFGRDKSDYKPSNMWVLTTTDIRSGKWDGPFCVGPAFNTEDRRELIDLAMLQTLMETLSLYFR